MLTVTSKKALFTKLAGRRSAPTHRTTATPKLGHLPGKGDILMLPMPLNLSTLRTCLRPAGARSDELAWGLVVAGRKKWKLARPGPVSQAESALHPPTSHRA
jgi:hypothetical protein